MHGKDVPGEIDSNGDNGSHGFPLLRSVDETLHFPSWHCTAGCRNCAAGSGRGNPFHSLAVIQVIVAHMGKQIRIYLADGTASSIRHAEITNWTGQALACPRSRFQDLREWDEVKRPGVYFLFGTAEDSGDDAVYIGESEVVLDRLYAHIAGKEFWAELIAFTSKDDNLTKGHVKYLESRLIQLASEAGRYRVTNSALR
ncbi:MAG: GIY-YIG nuclease family protein [Polaromonas sp.]